MSAQMYMISKGTAADSIFIFGQYVPQHSGEETSFAADVGLLSKARKHEAKLRLKCEKAAHSNMKAFKAAAKTYLSCQRCLLVALFEDNARRPLCDRMTLAELSALSHKYDILKNLGEPARVWQQPKASGNGMRVVCSFGPVARAAQRMVSTIIRLTHQPQDFQFANLNFAEKVQYAMTTIKEKGYCHVTEIDIRDFFPNFTEETLIKSLPLPKEAIRQIVLSNNTKWGSHPLYIQHGYISSPPGIPQGSASSAAVADWCIANMPLKALDGSVVINHVDNFFALSASICDAQNVSKALSAGISGLPGGEFSSKLVQETTPIYGFKMLGCWVTQRKDGTLQADPTDANLKNIRQRARQQRQQVNGRLTAAIKSNSIELRIKGLQDYLRLESMCRGWVQAFEFCGITTQTVKDDFDYNLYRLRQKFQITEKELKPLKDHSTNVQIKWYSGL